MNRLSIPRQLQCTVALCVMVVASPFVTYAQQEMACGAAVPQLQTYVQQVNSIAQYEYNQGIPGRCGYNGYCAQSLLQQLSAWYGQQSVYVNQWYAAIVGQCSKASQQRRSTARKRQSDPTEDIQDVDDLKVDDEDKTVKIRIPSKPGGFTSRPR